MDPGTMTKSGLMLGLGETRDELLPVFEDLRRHDCEILTLGQYLQPTPAHLPVDRYWHPDEFAELKERALEMGFAYVESGPLVRSSYHAEEQAGSARGGYLAPRVTGEMIIPLATTERGPHPADTLQ